VASAGSATACTRAVITAFVSAARLVRCILLHGCAQHGIDACMDALAFAGLAMQHAAEAGATAASARSAATTAIVRRDGRTTLC
jgi:hypothetical protein